MVPVVVALGSNLGDRFNFIQLALRQLNAILRDLRASSIYRSAPQYVENQPDFFNAIVVGNTNLSPRQLLANLKQIESELGRKKRERFGPREIDLDLIYYGSLRYIFSCGGNGPELEVPHPKIRERRFVLVPWAELEPERSLLGLGSLLELAQQPSILKQPLEVLEDARLSV